MKRFKKKIVLTAKKKSKTLIDLFYFRIVRIFQKAFLLKKEKKHFYIPSLKNKY